MDEAITLIVSERERDRRKASSTAMDLCICCSRPGHSW